MADGGHVDHSPKKACYQATGGFYIYNPRLATVLVFCRYAVTCGWYADERRWGPWRMISTIWLGYNNTIPAENPSASLGGRQAVAVAVCPTPTTTTTAPSLVVISLTMKDVSSELLHHLGDDTHTQTFHTKYHSPLHAVFTCMYFRFIFSL